MAEQRDYDEKALDEFVRTGDEVAMVELLSTVTHSPSQLVQEDINRLVGYKEPVPEPARAVPSPSPGMYHDGPAPAPGAGAAVRQRDPVHEQRMALERQSLDYLARRARRDVHARQVQARGRGIPVAPLVWLAIVLYLVLVFHA